MATARSWLGLIDALKHSADVPLKSGAGGYNELSLRRGPLLRTIHVTIGAGEERALRNDWLSAPPRPLAPSGDIDIYSNAAMMRAGIVLTSVGIALVPIGVGLWAGTTHSGPPDDDGIITLSNAQAAGVLLSTAGSALLMGIGIPLWLNGAKPPGAYAGAPLPSWSLAPLTLPPLRGSSARAPGAPAGLAVVGTF